MLLNVPDEKDVCSQLLVFRAINRALITLAYEVKTNQLLLRNLFLIKINFQKIRIITLRSIYITGLLKFQIFFGVLEIPDNLGMNGRCWAQAY